MKKQKFAFLFLFFFLGPFAEAKTLRVPLLDAPVNLDWTGMTTFVEAPLILNLCEGLFTYDPKSGKLIMGIAESVTKSADLKQYTFKIRKDAKWSDGKPIYAQDFVEGWKRLISPQSTSIYSYYLYDVVNAEEYNSKKVSSFDSVGVKATQDKTLVVQLKRALPKWEENTAFWPFFPVRKDIIEKHGTDAWRAGILPSSGPFVFESYEKGKKILFKRNLHYRKTKSNLTEIEFQLFESREDALKAYEKGLLDYDHVLPFSNQASNGVGFEKRKDFRSAPLYRHYVLALNSNKYPINNADFRKALLTAINPNDFFPKGSTSLWRAQTLIPAPLVGSQKLIPISFDPKAARVLLKKSGVILGPKAAIRILTTPTEPFFSIGKALQKQIEANLGVPVELSVFENKEMTTYLDLGEYAGTAISWTTKVLNAQDFLLPYSSSAKRARVTLSEKKYDQWLSKAVTAKQNSDAEKYFFEAQKAIILEERVLIPLFFEALRALVKPTVKNLYFNPQGIGILKDVVLN